MEYFRSKIIKIKGNLSEIVDENIKSEINLDEEDSNNKINLNYDIKIDFPEMKLFKDSYKEMNIK
jgi:hypothetical protein